MNTFHEKPPCCRGKIWRRSNRRRQCSICKKTWRAWKRKRGRKNRRQNFGLLFQYLKHESGSLRQQAQKRHLTAAGFGVRMSKIVQMFNKTSKWPEIPNGELIAVADAMIEYIKGKPHTFYFILIRAVKETKAVILPITVTIGAGEGFHGWRSAWKVVPPQVHTRIRVLVCDGVQALATIADEESWILQRCQFHLRARISHNCSPRRFGKRPQFGQQIQRLVQTVLTSKDEEKIHRALYRITLAKEQIRSAAFRTVISGFLKHYQDYRSYLRFSELHIPTTSNSAEFLIGQIRDLQYRAHGFSTLRSLGAWIEAYCKYTKTITCNGKNVPI